MPTDIAEFEAAITISVINKYFAGIALTLCAYDWLVLIERESQTAWKARWTRTKAIYYINRVMSLVGLTLMITQNTDLWPYPLSQRFCRFYIWFVPLVQLFSSYLSNVILTLRVVALYNRHNVVKRILYVVLILSWIISFIPTIHSQYLWSSDIDYMAPVHECLSTVNSPSDTVIFITGAVLEGVLFAFTLYRAILDYRSGVVVGFPNSRFLFILYRDGFYYFAAVGAVNVWNAFQYAIAPMSGMFMGVYFTWAMMTVMSSRVYLNLILAAHGGGRDGLTTGGLSSFRTGPTINNNNHHHHAEGAEGERGQIVTFGAKRSSRRVVPMETFTTTVLTAEYNTQADAELEDSRGEGGEAGIVVVVTEEPLEPKGEEV